MLLRGAKNGRLRTDVGPFDKFHSTENANVSSAQHAHTAYSLTDPQHITFSLL